MRIAVVGNTAWRWSAESDWVADLEGLGHEVVPIYEPATKSRLIVQRARNTDLVLWIGGSRTHAPSVIRECSKHVTTVGISTDLYWGLGRRGNWRSAPAFHADYVFTADGGNQDLWATSGINHQWMLPGVRKRWVDRKGQHRAGFACDVAFVGNNGSTYHEEWPYRKELVAQLEAMCKRNKWKFASPGGKHVKIERNHRLSNFYASARVTVGDSLCFDREKALYWSDRVYEASGRGGVLVMPRIDRLAKQVPWMPTYEWGDWKDLEDTVRRLLGSEDDNATIRSAGREWAKNHTYQKRAETLLGKVA
jgi:hypothetical protein